MGVIFISNLVVCENDLASAHPNLLEEWDYEKNLDKSRS